MTITQHISIDLQQPGSAPVVHAVQGEEYTREVKVTLYSGGVSWTPPSGCEVAIRYGKPDGKGGIYDKLPDNKIAWSILNNTISITLAPQMLTVAGIVNAQVEIIVNEKKILSTFHFIVDVEEDASMGAVKSENYTNWKSFWFPQTTGAKAGQYVKVTRVDSDGHVLAVSPTNEPNETNQLATNAKNTAESANSKAEQATTLANKAQSTANSALEKANSALPGDSLPDVINDALAQAKESGEFDGEDGKNGSNGLSILAVNITAGDAQKIEVYPDNVIENEGALFPRDILVGDKVLTQDGKIFIVDSWGTKFDSSSGTSITYYGATFFVDAGGGIKSVNGVIPDENGNVEIPVSGGSVDLSGYATEQFVQDGFQPKGDYLPSEELPNAVNSALADAKESGAFDGKDGASVTVASISESAEDGGSNVVTFSDGKTLTVKNGSKGSDGESVTVPQAVVDGASAVVNKSLSRGSESVLRFIAFSDAHQKNDDVNITAGNKELGIAIGEIVNRIGVDFASNLGDSGWSAYANTTEEVREQIKTLNSFIQPHIKGEQQLNAEGNHDDSVYSTIDADGDGVTSSTEKFSLAETYSLIWAKNRDVVYDPDHAIDGYCYKDFGHIKTRVICLNTEQGTGDGGIIEGYQLKWFAETALNMSGKTNWNVVTLAHHPLDWGHGSLFKDCVNIVDAFINGSNFSYTTTDGTAIAVDYSDKNCQYVGHFHGHTHAFSIVRMTKYVNDSYVDMKAWQIGIPNACYTRNNHNLGNVSERIARFSTPTTYDKSNVDGQRTSFNLVSVDLDNKIIYADNYGAGIDRQVSFAFEETVYTITNALTNCTSGNSAASIEENASYSAMITPDDGYEMSSITVTMGGTDVTASVVNGKEISIGNVTGNIVITAVAEAISAKPTYTNQIPISTDTDDSVYNGKGFKENTRIETSGATGTKNGIGATGFIRIGVGSSNTARGEQVIYMANIDAALDANTRIAFYKSDKTFIGLEYAKNLKDASADPGGSVSLYTKGADGYINMMDFTGLTSYYKNSGKGETAFFRIGAPGLDGDSIITVNEPIE